MSCTDTEPTRNHVKQLRDSLHELEGSAGFQHTASGRAAIRCVRLLILLIADLAKRVEAIEESRHG
jgi:cystathionine beta-lyase/cystathionine gamma-synthase